MRELYGIPDQGVNAGMVSDMSNVNRGDDDPGANTAMFQRFVDDGTKPGTPSRRQSAVRIGAIAVVAVVALAVLVVILLG
jgi:hypothetical protein